MRQKREQKVITGVVELAQHASQQSPHESRNDGIHRPYTQTGNIFERQRFLQRDYWVQNVMSWQPIMQL